MKKKKNIKVPAYLFGTESKYPTPQVPTQGPTQYQREVFGDKAFKGGSQLASFGTIMGQVPDAINLLASPFQTSTATSGGEAAMQSIQGIGKGAATGAAIGGVPGAVAGALLGSIGSKGESASMTSFTDYNKGTLGTGLIGAFGNKGLRKQLDQIKMNAYNNRAAVQGSNYLQFEAAQQNSLMNNLTTAADGGMIPSLAYVDDGELIQTPDGQMLEVPEQNKPTDSNLVSLPEGSLVLSDKLKFPGTKKSIAQVGKEMMRTPKTKGKDRFAENSRMLNERNNKMIYDQLFSVQEQLKEQKGIKPKTKSLVQAAADGDRIYRRRDFVPGQSYTDMMYDQYAANPVPEFSVVPPGSYSGVQTNEVAPTTAVTKKGSAARPRKKTNTTVEPSGTQFQNYKAPTRATRNEVARPNFNTASSLGSVSGPITPTKQAELNNLYNIGENRRKIAAADRKRQQRQTMYNNITDGIQGVFGDASTLVPALSNLFAKGSDPVQANLNPYAQGIMNTMGGRRFNIQPAMDDLGRNRAIANYNMRNMNTGTGANMAYSLQSATNSDRAIQSLRAQESNANNAYLGEYANMANNLGQQYVGAVNTAYDINSQNAAALNNVRRQGLSQLSQYGQNKRLMDNQASRDDAMLQLYAPFLEAAYTKGTRYNFNKHIKRGGNDVG